MVSRWRSDLLYRPCFCWRIKHLPRLLGRFRRQTVHRRHRFRHRPIAFGRRLLLHRPPLACPRLRTNKLTTNDCYWPIRRLPRHSRPLQPPLRIEDLLESALALDIIIEDEDAHLPGLDRSRRGTHCQSIASGVAGGGWKAWAGGVSANSSHSLSVCWCLAGDTPGAGDAATNGGQKLLAYDEIGGGDVPFGGGTVPKDAVSA